VIFLFRQMIRIFTFYFSHLADRSDGTILREDCGTRCGNASTSSCWDFDLRELNGDDLRRDPLNVDARQRVRASGAGLAIE
jgi:hypothetical protein